MGFRDARIKAGKSAAEAASALHVSRAAISQWENGIYIPRTQKLMGMAQFYNCSIEELLTNNVSNLKSVKTD